MKVDVASARALADHHDGHGLNEELKIQTDAPDGSGAAHHYHVTFKDEIVAQIQFQQGPRFDPSSIPGITEAVLLTVMIDRVRGFQNGPYACRENAIILTKLEECLHWTRHRADERAKRGVLGKNEK